jgi:hypothetical protein
MKALVLQRTEEEQPTEPVLLLDIRDERIDQIWDALWRWKRTSTKPLILISLIVPPRGLKDQ